MIKLLGLDQCPPFHRDRIFLLAAAGGPMFWVAVALTTSLAPIPWARIWSLPFLVAAVLLPVIEELCFRGLIQGEFIQCSWGRRAIRGVTLANCATSVLFMAGHWLTHSPLWALSVIFPSVIFGLVRDRLQSSYPAILLHCFYNSGYFILVGSGAG